MLVMDFKRNHMTNEEFSLIRTYLSTYALNVYLDTGILTFIKSKAQQQEELAYIGNCARTSNFIQRALSKLDFMNDFQFCISLPPYILVYSLFFGL